MGRILGDDLANPATEHCPRPTRTNSPTGTNVSDHWSGIDGDLLRDEEVVGSNPDTRPRSAAHVGPFRRDAGHLDPFTRPSRLNNDLDKHI
jgi:hypothetical protein